MLSAGIDIGSVTTKCVITRDGKILSSAITRTGADIEKSGLSVFNEALSKSGFSEKEIQIIISTGYGRRMFAKAQKVITEISAAGLGAWRLFDKKGCIVIDVGGQDTKVIEVSDKGIVTDFLMNDKCAAGTGRFIEMMAQALETDLDGISLLSENAQKAVSINSTCSVFAESEVISLIAQAEKKENIARGLFDSIASRIAPMARSMTGSKEIVFCGGGAKSAGLVHSLENAVGRKVHVLPTPQFAIAYGASLSI